MRAGGLRAQLAEFGGQLRKGVRALGQVDAGEVDDNALPGLFKQLHHLAQAWWGVRLADSDRTFQPGVISLRIDDAKLEAVLGETFQKARRQGRFAAAGCPCNQQIAGKGIKLDHRAV